MIRVVKFTQPPGDWVALELQEHHEGQWTTVQAALVTTDPVTVAFKPRHDDATYRPLWVPVGGGGVSEGETVDVHGRPVNQSRHR